MNFSSPFRIPHPSAFCSAALLGQTVRFARMLLLRQMNKLLWLCRYQRTLNVHTSFHSPTIVILLISYSHSIDLNAICKSHKRWRYISPSHSPLSPSVHALHDKLRLRWFSVRLALRFIGVIWYDLRRFFVVRSRFLSFVKFLCRCWDCCCCWWCWCLRCCFCFFFLWFCSSHRRRVRCSFIFFFLFMQTLCHHRNTIFILSTLCENDDFIPNIRFNLEMLCVKTEEPAWSGLTETHIHSGLRSSLVGFYGHVSVNLHV